MTLTVPTAYLGYCKMLVYFARIHSIVWDILNKWWMWLKILIDLAVWRKLYPKLHFLKKFSALPIWNNCWTSSLRRWYLLNSKDNTVHSIWKLFLLTLEVNNHSRSNLLWIHNFWMNALGSVWKPVYSLHTRECSLLLFPIGG